MKEGKSMKHGRKEIGEKAGKSTEGRKEGGEEGRKERSKKGREE